MIFRIILNYLPLEIFGLKLPRIPKSKRCHGKTTPEQDAFLKILKGQSLTQSDKESLDDAYIFMIHALRKLKMLNLSKLMRFQIPILKNYLRSFLDIELTVQDTVDVGLLFRMTWIKEFNEENGKVRDPKYLGCTPLGIVKSRKKYGRANTSNSTCLYLAETPQAAVFECKPDPGDRIIITGWAPKGSNKEFPTEANKFRFYMINNTQPVNSSIKSNTEAMNTAFSQTNPYLGRVLKKIQQFIGDEFTKDVPIVSKNQYEYFFSGFFADRIMNSVLKINPIFSPTNLGQYDGIMYPSIANKYKYNNLAIRESTIPRFEPLFCTEILVKETFYDDFCESVNHLPIAYEKIRESVKITKKILWNDD